VVQPGRSALDEIRRKFGPGILTADGALDRKSLRAIIFADNARRQQLEQILHPRIRDESLAQVSRATGPYVVIVVPLLVESPMQEFMDRIVVVDCDEEIQLARLLARDTETEAQARSIIAAQSGRDERLAIADDIITNNDDLLQTRHQVEALHAKFLSRD
jgi:dephospho-CoA kinase